IFNKVNVEADNKKILDIKDTKYTIIPRKIPDYKSFANIQNNLPPSFTIGAEIDVVKHDAKIKIPPSLISPFEYHESIRARCQLDVDSNKISLAFKDIITKANIDLTLHDVKLDIAELSANIKLRNEANISNSEVAISFVPRKGFTDKIITTIINNQTIKNFAVMFERADLISSFKSQIPPFTIGAKYRFKWNIGARSSGNKTNISISEMNAFTENNVGFGLKGDIRTNDLDFKMNADLLLFNAKEMVSYWTRHYMPEDNHKLDPDLAAKVKDFNSDLVFTVLKDISEFPKSTSKDIALKILAKNNHITISNNDISSIMQKYISTKTKMVSKAILEQKNPSEFILQVAPELEILMDGLLNKNSDSKKKNIGKSLWQRLIK
ncbi:MAG: hypothetical protein EB127_11480, partial [Alphaproteobacteria bacterium]|nr:hypothetical protein [Alphaproteobacteria bacterium]